MRYTAGYRNTGISFSGAFPPGVKWLLVVNIAVFVLYFFTVQSAFGVFFQPLKLVPRDVLEGLAIWQLATYLFLHDPFGFGHILFNMLTLWMFGRDLEHTWGTRRFLRYYFLCGIGAGVCVVAANALVGNVDRATIGASGAIYGLLLAFGMLFPDSVVLFSFLFPIKAKYFVMILGVIAFMSSLSSGNSRVSNVAHLGGMVFGFLYLKTALGVRAGKFRLRLGNPLRERYRDWKIQRAKKKFEVYLRKQDRDRWVN